MSPYLASLYNNSCAAVLPFDRLPRSFAHFVVMRTRQSQVLASFRLDYPWIDTMEPTTKSGNLRQEVERRPADRGLLKVSVNSAQL